MRRYCLKKRFQIARKAADTRLKARPNVIGTGLGVKVKNGERTDELCLIVFVDKKRAKTELAEQYLIPKEVRRYGLDLPTDVIAVKPPRFEAGIKIIDGGAEIGTVGSFARQGDAIFAVTCEHCIRGPDGNSETPDNITALNLPGMGGPLLLGRSGPAILNSGTGVMPHYGEIDAALVNLHVKTLINALLQRQRRPVFRPPQTSVSRKQLEDLFLFTPVRGIGGQSGPVAGRVAGLLLRLGGIMFDFMIETVNGQPITQRGDSGLMWITQLGSSFGLHTRGDGMSPDGRSMRSFGAFAYRIEEVFNIAFIAD